MDTLHISLVRNPFDWWNHFTIEAIEDRRGKFLGVNVRAVEYADDREFTREHIKGVLESYLRRKTIELMKTSQNPSLPLDAISKTIDTTQEYLRLLSKDAPLSFERIANSWFRDSPGSKAAAKLME